MVTASAIKLKAREVGFDLCGIAPAARHAKLARLESWLEAGYGGQMSYLGDSLHERSDVSQVLPGARSVISLAVLYNTTHPLSVDAAVPGQAAIARYAWGDDYHDVVRLRLRALLRWLSDTHGPGLEAFSCVDNGPIQERVFAEQAGLGWIGKNTCLINPKIGSWLFLAEIVCSLALDTDEPGMDQCGTCTRCLDACPTQALTEPYRLDARRCLSYLTIETRHEVPVDMRDAVGPQIFGCDICQDVCPWNRRAEENDEQAWQPREGLAFPRLLDLCELSDDAWRGHLKGSALRRAGLRRIRRSLAYAAAKLPPDAAAAALDALAGQPTSEDPEVADAIHWARERLTKRR
jgi:epoxyqueuosine reductase